jgi:hypothetical protein
VSISSSITWSTLPNGGSRTYVLLSDIIAQLLLQYFIVNTPIITNGNLLSPITFSSWFISYVCGGGWDPTNPKSKSIYCVSWASVVTLAINYVTPTLTAGQHASDTVIVQIAQLLLNDFGNTQTFVAMQTQI